MADVTLYHNTACSTSRRVLDTAQETGTVQVIQYLKTPLTRQELLDLLAKLADPAADLVRKDKFFTEQGLVADDYVTPEAVAELLVRHPRLMQRPVVVKGDRAIIGRPADKVATFLAQ